MAIVLSLFLIVVPLFSGSLVRKLYRDKEGGAGETYIVGVLALFFIWEALSVAAVYLALSFRLIVRIYSGVLLAVTSVSLLLEWKKLKELRLPAPHFSPVEIVSVLLFLALVLLYALTAPDMETDYTLENVRTILHTDSVYGYHPGTGEPLPYPMSLRGKIQSLVPFYAYLSLLIGGDPAVVVYRLAPVWALAMCLIAYGVLMDIAIPDREKGRERRAYCYLVLLLLLFMGSLSGEGIFYMQLHRGYRGETWVIAILLPYLLFLCYRILHEGSALRLVYLVMAVTVSVMWADLRLWTVQLLIAIAAALGIAVAMRIGGRRKG